MSRLKTILTEYPLDTMPKEVLKRIDFINEKCLTRFSTEFSRNTLSKPHYRSLWHPKYTQEMKTKKEPAFSFKLAMGCFKAIALKVLVTIELLLSSRKHNTEKQQSEKEASRVIQKAIAPPLCSIKNSEPDKMLQTSSTQEFQQSDRTLMKWVVGLRPYLVYRVFILKLELVKLEIKQKLENLLIPEIKTSETKFKDVRRARRKNSYFYHGIEVSSHSGLTRRGDEVINLKPGTAELASSIKQLFGSEDDEAVLLSTVHRAKGMESERVYIAEPLTLPLLWEGQKQWQEQQEQNLLYVALSRSTKDLFLIGDAFWFDGNRASQQNLLSVEKTTANSDGDLVKSRIATASNEELEQYAKLIRLEQGKRVELNFSSLF